MDNQLTAHQSVLTLTVTRRLALRMQQAQVNRQTKPQVMPRIMALNDWVLSLWQHCQIRGVFQDLTLLSPIQEQAIWLDIIESSDYGQNLLRPMQTAKQTMNTFKLLCQWQLDIESIDWGVHEEALIFKEWAFHFIERLQAQQKISSAQIPDILLNALREDSKLLKTLLPFEQIVFAGFDDYPPYVQAWQQYFQDLGKTIHTYTAVKPTSHIQRFEFADLKQELYAIAEDAKQWTQQHDGVYAIVVPDLIKYRDKIEIVFQNVLDQAACVAYEDQVSWQFNISAGRALIDYPIVHALFKSLELAQNKVPLTDIRDILSNPFLIGGMQEQLARECWLADLKQHKKSLYHLDELLQRDLSDLEHLKTLLTSAQALRHDIKGQKSIDAWQGVLFQWMESIDWPGSRCLNSPEHQVVQRFYQVVEEWRQLDSLSCSMSWYDAMLWLKNLCAETTFQPESNPVRIQIMGLLEASGQQFDKIWILGLHNEAWPAKPKPNAFIPVDIQTKYQMPHANAQRELAFAQHLTSSLMASAPWVCFSHAQTNEGKIFQPSPLIQSIVPEVIQSGEVKTLEQIIFYSQKIEEKPDEANLPISSNESIHGGTSIIQSQAACPFQAFARYRLHALEPEPQGIGISALDRGKMIHAALERVWQQLKDYHGLCAQTDESMDDLLHQTVQWIENQFNPQLGLYWDIEKRRMHRVLRAWLTLEKDRQPFKVVKTEVNTQVNLKGLKLNCWLDRVDITDRGEPIIIDYKSGSNTLNDLFGERLHAPQLPLYCFADFPQNPKGVVFAIVRRETCEFIGITEHPDRLPNVASVSALKGEDVPKNWSDLLSYWQTILEDLSLAFQQGEHQVDPKTAQSCMYCDLESLCRVKEQAHA